MGLVAQWGGDKYNITHVDVMCVCVCFANISSLYIVVCMYVQGERARAIALPTR